MGQTTSGLTTSRSGLTGGSGGGASNLPPLLFHNVHGDNIRISRDGTTAKRVESFCKGIVFSSRPVKVNERVCLKFVEISHNWSGVIRFGFTYSDPSGHRNGAALPKYACPDLTNKPGYWAKALPERYCTTNGTMLHYYVTASGDVHFGINGEEKGVFFGGVDCRGPLWALIDVYGNSTAIELVGQQMLNNTRNLNNNVERIMQPLSQLMIDDGNSSAPITAVSQCQVAPLRYQQGAQFAPMPLHQTRGRNVKFIDSSTAYRTDTEFCQGYVFTGRPLQLNERIVVQILNTEPMFHGCLALGLTSCDPHQLTTSDLPDDSNFLLDRPEYWVIARDFARNLNKFDEISFCITNSGEVHISRNGATPLVVMHVDQTLKLWAFFDIYGSTQKIRVLSKSSISAPCRSIVSNNNNNSNSQNRLCLTSGNSDSINSLNSQSELRRARPVNAVASCGKSTAATAAAATGSSALLVIINPDAVTTLPVSTAAVSAAISSHSSSSTSASQLIHSQIAPQLQATTATSNNNTSSGILNVAAATGTIISSCSSSHYVEPISSSSNLSTAAAAAAGSPWLISEPNHHHQQAGASIGGKSYASTATTSTECTICYEKQIDAVLYMCGHMCMCYECALQQWRGKGGGQCPLCRAVIKDVIRTYKS